MDLKKIKIIFFGTPNFSDTILKMLIKEKIKPSLIVTSPDKPIGRKQIVTPPPVKKTAKENKIKFFQPENEKEIEEKIKELNPDLIITAATGIILSKEILKIPKYGCLNIHPSLLPKYRGPSPIQAAILNGDKKTGVSIIKMTEGIDEGPILANSSFIIENVKISYEDLEKELAKISGKLIKDTIPKWINGEIEPEEQDDLRATYTKKIKKEDGKINWDNSAEEIERKIRAFNPWPSAFCIAENKVMKILEASVLEQTKNGPSEEPGKVYLAANDQIAVQCGKDYLIVEELQFSGKNKLKVEDFLKGNIDFIGITLK
jgi:methionyl-tRNA formyltransferase